MEEKIIEQVEKVTGNTFNKKGNLIPVEEIEPTFEDLLCEINSLKEKIEDEIEQRENYYKPKSEYELLGISERDFI